MFTLVTGSTADHIWQEYRKRFLTPGITNVFEGRDGKTTELLHAAFTLTDPRQRWVVSRRAPMNPTFALVELLWILAGRSDSRFLTFFNRDLWKYSGAGPVFHGAYGNRLRAHFGLDQLYRAYRALRDNPTSRQIVLQIWDARYDLPDLSGQPRDKDIPCNLISMLKLRDNRLHWTQVMRSNDFYLGMPYNLIQFTTLQEIFAGWLGLKLGEYNHISDSLHVYERHYDRIKSSTPVEVPVNTDDLTLDYTNSIELISDMSRRVARIIEPQTNEESILKMSELPSGAKGYKNIMLTISASVARKRRWHDLANELMEMNSNPVYRELWAQRTRGSQA